MSKKVSLIDQTLFERRQLSPLVGWAQKLLSGLPAQHDALKITTPLRLLGADLLWLSMFMAFAMGGAWIAMAGPALSIIGAILMVMGVLGAIGRLRRIVVGHVHEATHGVTAKFYQEAGLTENRAASIGEFILDFGSALTFTLNGQAYRDAHEVHHDEYLGTRIDPDGADLYNTGLWPSLTDRPLLSLALRLASPVYHVKAFAARVHTNLIAAKPSRRVLGAVALAGLIGSAFVLPFWIWFVGVFLVWGPGYQAAALLQVMTEHPYGHNAPAKSLSSVAERTWERIPYRPMPVGGNRDKVWPWLSWTGVNLVHIASRLAVLDDTMIAHGYHHLAWPIERPFNDWWNTSAYMVRAYHDGALPGGHETRVVEGLPEALMRQSAHFRALRSK